jgi:hypothetical protein
MSDLSDLLNDVKVISNKSNNARSGSNRSAISEVKLKYGCDIVLSKDDKKYILGTNQLFPIYQHSFLNGSVYDIQMYLYAAVVWRDMIYTNMGSAVHPDEDPDSMLGYGGGIYVYNYKGGSPCIADSIKGRDITVDDWCQLTYNALPVSTNQSLPKLWIKAEGGHKFWTPDEGIISALPVNIPMILDTAEKFSSLINYRLGGSTMASKVRAMLYEYTLKYNIDKLYIGFPSDIVSEPEQFLVDAYEWRNTHRMRLGEIQYNESNLFSHIRDSKVRQLCNAVNNGCFDKEALFL